MASQNFKLKLLTLISKLSDRDTYATAAAELNSIATTLTSATLPTFLSCILSIDSNDKPLARKHSLHLLSSLSHHHSVSLSTSLLPKILAFLTRRLRDSDSSVRSLCVETVYNLVTNVKRSNFCGGLMKGLSELAFTERELNAQMGSALCLAAAIDGLPDPDPEKLGRVILTKMERLVKSEGYKAKSAGLVVIGSVIGVGGVKALNGVGGLVKFLIGFLSSGDWAVRKAAAEALEKLAVVEKEGVVVVKEGCLKVFESRRFDKVKAVREVMNRMIEAWKEVPDVAHDTSLAPRSVASSKEDVSDDHCLPGSKAFLMRKKLATNCSTPPDGSLASMARNRGLFKSSEKKASTANFQKAGHKNPVDINVESLITDNSPRQSSVNVGERRLRKPDARRALFTKNSDEKVLNSEICVAPCHVENTNSSIRETNDRENRNNNHKECEGFSLIRSQLAQIEKQQSSLLDVLQRFIGTSQNGMRSLETRVHSLELALDKISYDLALSNGSMADSKRSQCFPLTGAEFLSYKFWRKAGHSSRSRFSTSNPSSLPEMTTRRVNRMGNAEALEIHRLSLHRDDGFIVNPLAEVHSESRKGH